MTVLLAAPAGAGPLGFDEGWSEQRLNLAGMNAYTPAGTALEVASDGTVSLIWAALPQEAWRQSST